MRVGQFTISNYINEHSLLRRYQNEGLMQNTLYTHYVWQTKFGESVCDVCKLAEARLSRSRKKIMDTYECRQCIFNLADENKFAKPPN